jgi:hypothetical protein
MCSTSRVNGDGAGSGCEIPFRHQYPFPSSANASGGLGRPAKADLQAMKRAGCVALRAPALIRRYAPPSPAKERGRRGRISVRASSWKVRVHPIETCAKLIRGMWVANTRINFLPRHFAPSPNRKLGEGEAFLHGISFSRRQRLRHVACTRARGRLLITGVAPAALASPQDSRPGAEY